MTVGIVEESKARFEETTLSDGEILKTFVDDFEKSTAFRLMTDGKAYYRGDNAILGRKLYYYDAAGNRQEDEEKPNNRLSHPFMRLAVDEKVNYLLGTSPLYGTMTDKGKAFADLLNEVLGEDFDDVLNDVGTESSNAGIGWLHVFVDADPMDENANVLGFMSVDSVQVIPLWADAAHRKLEGVIRTYFVEEYEGSEKVSIRKVEVWTSLTVNYFEERDGKYILDIEKNPTGNPVGHYEKGGQMFGWGVVPFVPFRNNSLELPDLYAVKSLVDDYDRKTSDNSNTLEEIQDVVYVLKNYSGTSLAEFVANLRHYRAVKTDEEGGVDTVNADMNPEAMEAHLDRLREDFHTFGQSVDMSTDKFGDSPSGVALEFLYSGLKLKANAMERKFKSSFRTVFQLVAEFLKATGNGEHDWREAKVTFTRTTITNVTEALAAVTEAAGTHSKRTALENSPWVEDVEDELKRIEEEGADSLDKDFTPTTVPTDDGEDTAEPTGAAESGGKPATDVQPQE